MIIRPKSEMLTIKNKLTIDQSAVKSEICFVIVLDVIYESLRRMITF
jgi:hypothetical protein